MHLMTTTTAGFALLAVSVIGPARSSAKTAAQIATCDAGDLATCNMMGFLCDQAGRASEAVRYFRQVCDGGVAAGCSNLAEFYYDGRGVAQDRQQAGRLFVSACEAGVSSGCAGSSSSGPRFLIRVA